MCRISNSWIDLLVKTDDWDVTVDPLGSVMPSPSIFFGSSSPGRGGRPSAVISRVSPNAAYDHRGAGRADRRAGGSLPAVAARRAGACLDKQRREAAGGAAERRVQSQTVALQMFTVNVLSPISPCANSSKAAAAFRCSATPACCAPRPGKLASVLAGVAGRLFPGGCIWWPGDPPRCASRRRAGRDGAGHRQRAPAAWARPARWRRSSSTYVASVARLEFGKSFVTGEPVSRVIAEPAGRRTMELAMAALVLVLGVGVPAGMAGGWH